MRAVFKWGIGAGVIVFFVGMAIERDQRADAERSVTPAQRAARDARNSQMAKVVAGVVALRATMKDPESFTVREVLVTANGTGCIDYRAKNSFGATFPDQAVVTADGKVWAHERNQRQFLPHWNKFCTVAGATDLTKFTVEMLATQK